MVHFTISKLHIGQTRLTLSFILQQEEQRQSIACHEFYNLKLFHIECESFTLIRQRFLTQVI